MWDQGLPLACAQSKFQLPSVPGIPVIVLALPDGSSHLILFTSFYYDRLYPSNAAGELWEGKSQKLPKY
jgi:hypothetical protein